MFTICNFVNQNYFFMNKTVKLEPPKINEWILVENNKIGTKQEGLKKDVLRYHISELSEDEAKEYAELYKQKFLEKYYSK